MRRVMHAIWMGSPLPDDYAANIEKFAELNPRWEIRVWGEEECREVLPSAMRDLFDAAREITVKDSVWQLRSDIARLAILYRHGGLYVDTDFDWRKPIDPLLASPPRSVVTAWEKDNRFVANGFIYSERPRHTLFRQCFSDLPGRVYQRRGQRANRITGPSGQWTSICRRRRDVKIIPSKHLFPYGWNELDRAGEPFPEAYGVHLWGHQQEIRGMR